MEIEKKIELTQLQAKILELLGIGKENATRLNDLQKRLGISERKIRIAIEEMRKEGYSILSQAKQPAGYYMCQTEEEGQEFLAFYLSYIKDLCITRQAVKMALKKKWTKSFGQIKLFN